jgi:hypothetical protein
LQKAYNSDKNATVLGDLQIFKAPYDQKILEQALDSKDFRKTIYNYATKTLTTSNPS